MKPSSMSHEVLDTMVTRASLSQDLLKVVNEQHMFSTAYHSSTPNPSPWATLILLTNRKKARIY